MYKIQAKTNSFLAKTPYSDPDWSPGVHDVPKGKHYFVSKVLGEANGMVQVVLGMSAGTWWLKEKDWIRILEGDIFKEAKSEDWKPQSNIQTDWVPQRSKQTADTEPNCPLEAPSRPDGGAEDGKPQSPSNDAPAPVEAPPRPNKLVYYAQRDNYRDANRSCFSSCCAMLLKFAKPDSIKSDDEYLKRVFEFGDTVNAETQIKALESYGVKALFETNCSIEKLQYHVCGKTGQPAAIGLLHRGNYLKPDINKSHYVVCSGYDYASDRFEIQDPWLDEYDWKEGVHNGFQDGVNQWWPSDALKYRFTVESKNGHYSSGWWLRIVV